MSEGMLVIKVKKQKERLKSGGIGVGMGLLRTSYLLAICNSRPIKLGFFFFGLFKLKNIN